MRLKLLLVLVFVLAPIQMQPARAERSQPRGYIVYGVGTVSCGKWIQEKQADDRIPGISPYAAYQDWVTGFVSGYGYGAPAILKETDSAGMRAFVDSYCAAHPLDKVSAAAKALVAELATP